MGRKRKQRRQSHGSAWHWKQTGCWYYTMPGTKKRVPLFDEEGQRIRGESNKEAAELALAKEKLSWEDGAFGAPDGSGPWLVPIGNERIPTSRLRLSEAWRPIGNDNAGLAARHGTGGKPTAGTTRRRGRNGVCRWSTKMASESVERTTARPRNWPEFASCCRKSLFFRGWRSKVFTTSSYFRGASAVAARGAGAGSPGDRWGG